MSAGAARILANQASNFLTSGVSPQRLGNAHPNIVPYEAFKTADGHIVLAVGNDGQFGRFCTLAQRNDLSVDERFSTNPKRVEHREHLVPIVAAIMHQQSTAWWLEHLNASGVPCGPVNSIEAVFADEHVAARGLRRDVPHTVAGTVPSVASPLLFDNTRACASSGPPTLGGHTHEVLRDLLGMTDTAIDDLRKGGAA
jgi:crotonobetainyl-CoA:carnitine CoA-transferase CaiB-like acyl-CoA transferase